MKTRRVASQPTTETSEEDVNEHVNELEEHESMENNSGMLFLIGGGCIKLYM